METTKQISIFAAAVLLGSLAAVILSDTKPIQSAKAAVSA